MNYEHDFKSNDIVTHTNLVGNLFRVVSTYVVNPQYQNPGLLCRALDNLNGLVKD
jgi:hypothetical protein